MMDLTISSSISNTHHDGFVADHSFHINTNNNGFDKLDISINIVIVNANRDVFGS